MGGDALHEHDVTAAGLGPDLLAHGDELRGHLKRGGERLGVAPVPVPATEIRGNTVKAEPYLVCSLSDNPDGPFSMHVLQSLIKIAAEAGDMERASRLQQIFELSAQIRAHPERPGLRTVRGRLFRSAGMPVAAAMDTGASR